MLRARNLQLALRNFSFGFVCIYEIYVGSVYVKRVARWLLQWLGNQAEIFVRQQRSPADFTSVADHISERQLNYLQGSSRLFANTYVFQTEICKSLMRNERAGRRVCCFCRAVLPISGEGLAS
jgi:hypothetical protein